MKNIEKKTNLFKKRLENNKEFFFTNISQPNIKNLELQKSKSIFEFNHKNNCEYKIKTFDFQNKLKHISGNKKIQLLNNYFKTQKTFIIKKMVNIYLLYISI